MNCGVHESDVGVEWMRVGHGTGWRGGVGSAVAAAAADAAVIAMVVDESSEDLLAW
jgi:hypothetical protein